MKYDKRIQSPERSAKTYAKVEADYINDIRSKGTSKQEIKNYRSTFKSWRSTLGFNEGDIIGNEFFRFFDHNISKYKTAQNKLLIKKSTYIPRLSRIKNLRNYFLNQSKTTNLPERFGERLVFLLQINNLSTREFVKNYLDGEISYAAVLKWKNNRGYPDPSRISIIKRFEKILNVPDGTLISTLPTPLTSRKTPRKLTTFGKKIQLAGQKKYGIMTAETIRELEKLTEFKSSVFRGGDSKRFVQSRWTRTTSPDEENIKIPTAEFAYSYLRKFFGFCHLPKENSDPMLRGMGIAKDHLTIALLAEENTVENYIKIFLYERSGKKFNGGFLTFLNFVTSLLRPNTGYIYLNPELTSQLRINMTVEEWQKKCIATRDKLHNLKNDIEYLKKTGSAEFGFGRDPQEPIQKIIELKNPLSVTLNMTKKMLDDVQKLSLNPVKQAILHRDTLLVSLFQANPLRAKMFRNMKLYKNLVQKPDKSWWIYFNRNDFKNRLHLNEDYEVQLTPKVWSMIETYLTEFRPVLLKGGISDYVFISSMCKEDSKDFFLGEGSIWEIVYKRTRQYIEESPGFGGHAYRHIIATSIVKNNPHTGIELAAKVLHDNPETVRKAYSHLRTNEMFNPYNDILAKNWMDAGLEGNKKNNSFEKEGNEQ